jgi:uncharacterized repeat protein (TIGR03803 family)
LTLFVFRTLEMGYGPGGLTVARDGSIYGWTATGGPGGQGTVFRASTDGSLTLIYAFSAQDQVTPLTGNVIQASDGNLWGTGGSGIFKLTPSGQFTVVGSFDYVTPLGLIAGIDGKMYGTLDHEGIPNYRMWMFSLTTSGTITQQVGQFNNEGVYFLTQRADGTLFVNLGGALFRVTPDFTDSYVVALPGYGVTAIDGLDGYLYGTSSNGGVNNAGTVFRVSPTVRHTHTLGDFDGDGKADITVYRPTTFSWYTSGSLGSNNQHYLGEPGDIPVPADYEGSGLTNRAVYQPSNGWWDIPLLDGQFISRRWGLPGDVPVPADYNGDGKTDIAVFRPSTGQWFIILSTTQTAITFTWGGPGDVPVPADYDGYGKSDLAVWRPSTGTWYVIQSATQTGAYVTWGGGGDIPVPSDYDGDGKADIAVFRPSTGEWLIVQSTTHTQMTPVPRWGGGGDIPVPGDYDGDGKTDIAVFRPSTGEWYIVGMPVLTWGGAGDIPILGRQ